MAKIHYIKGRIAAEPTKKTEEPSDVYHAVTLWLASRPSNSKRVYMSAASEWSLFLGLPFAASGSGALWKDAGFTHVQRYVNDRCQREAQQGRAADASPDGKVSLATVKHKISLLKVMYDSLIAQGLLSENPFSRMALELKRAKADQRRPHEEMTRDELRKFLVFERLLPEQYRDRAMFHLLFGAALRRSELPRLTLSDIQETNAGTTWLRLRMTKSGTAQKVALPDWVAREIEEFKLRRIREGASEKDLLFVRYLRRGTEPFGEKLLYNLFKRYCKLFGIKTAYSPHCARVTAITQLLKQGMSHHEVQQLSRHASVVMVEKYDRRRHEIDQSPSKKLSYDD